MSPNPFEIPQNTSSSQEEDPIEENDQEAIDKVRYAEGMTDLYKNVDTLSPELAKIRAAIKEEIAEKTFSERMGALNLAIEKFDDDHDVDALLAITDPTEALASTKRKAAVKDRIHIANLLISLKKSANTANEQSECQVLEIKLKRIDGIIGRIINTAMGKIADGIVSHEI